MPRIGGVAALDDVVPAERTITTNPPLTGGGTLAADRVLGVTFGTSVGTIASGGDSRFGTWGLYNDGSTPTSGQVPTWNGTRYTPQTPTGGASGGLDAEAVRDTIGSALVGGDNVSIAVDDTADTITISAAGSAGGTVSDATTLAKGIVRLAGDLAGTASAPTVPGAEKIVNKSTPGGPVPNGYIGADTAGLTPATLLPAATTATSGIVVLTGDLGGTASSPTVVKRGPVGGVQTPGYTTTMTPLASLGNHMRVSNVSGNVTVGVPTGGVDGQRMLLEFQMTGTSRTITLNNSYELGSNVTTRSITGASQNTWCYIGIVNRNGTWRVLAVDAGA